MKSKNLFLHCSSIRAQPLLLWNLHERTRMALRVAKSPLEQLNNSGLSLLILLIFATKSLPPTFWYQRLCVHLHVQAERKQDGGQLKRSAQGCLPLPVLNSEAQGGVLKQSPPGVTWSGKTQTAALPHWHCHTKHEISHLADVCQLSAWLCWWGLQFTSWFVFFKPSFREQLRSP